jgi:hypothetical protein
MRICSRPAWTVCRWASASGTPFFLSASYIWARFSVTFAPRSRPRIRSSAFSWATSWVRAVISLWSCARYFFADSVFR